MAGKFLLHFSKQQKCVIKGISFSGEFFIAIKQSLKSDGSDINGHGNSLR
jgi:hypothetical protein